MSHPFVPATIEVYRDRRGLFRWRLRARNRRIMADSGEGYSSRRGAVRAANRVAYLMTWVDIV